MPTSFPGADDVFTEPDAPASTPLDSTGTGTRDHHEHHRDAGDALMAMQAEATLLVHSHDGSTPRHGSKLAQANTHQSADTDSGLTSLHHTLGTGANQMAAGNHTHAQSTSHNSPDTDTATSALHHTIGSGANQFAAGNHVHSHPTTLFIKTTTSFVKASYPGLYAIEIELMGGGGGAGYCASTAASRWAWGVGGSGGAYLKTLILASDLGSSETVTIGVGGTGGTSGSKIGGTGGDSSFGTIVYAGGGSGGVDQPSVASATGAFTSHSFGGSFFAGPGHPASVIQIGVNGFDGGSLQFQGGYFFDSGAVDGAAGGGPYGVFNKTGVIGGIGASPTSSAAGLGYGSGGRGAFNTPSQSAENGGAGSAGLCVIKLIF